VGPDGSFSVESQEPGEYTLQARCDIEHRAKKSKAYQATVKIAQVTLEVE
jgi:hypothetical protein